MPQYLVGPTRPYTTIQAALNAIPGSIAGTGIHEVIVDAGTYTIVAALSVSVIGTDANNYIHLRAADGSEHYGDIATGVFIEYSGIGSTLSISSDYSRASNLVLRKNSLFGVNNPTSCISVHKNHTYENIIMLCDGDGYCLGVTTQVGNSVTPNQSYFYKCIAINRGTVRAESIRQVGFYGGGVGSNPNILGHNYTCVNCAAYNFYVGFSFSTNAVSSSVAVNCWAYHNGQSSASDFSGNINTSASSNNASRGTTAPGSNGLTSVTLAQLALINPSSYNFHISSNSVLYGVASNQSALFTTDWDLETVTTWSIGPDAEGIIANDEIDGAGECPLGNYYAADNFEIDGYLNENKWSSQNTAWEITNGAFHPETRVWNGPTPPSLRAAISNPSLPFKVTVEFQIGTMNGGFPGVGSQWWGIFIGSGSGFWSRCLAVNKQSNGVQRIVTGVSTGGPLTFTARLTGISANTPVVLSLEFDGANLLYYINGSLVFTETKPSGNISNVDAANGTYTVGGGDGLDNPSDWLVNWAHFWPYNGLGKLACGPSNVPTTSSSPWINQNEPHDVTDDAKPPKIKTKSGEPSSGLASDGQKKRDAKAPHLKTLSPEPSKGLSPGSDVNEPRVVSRSGPKGYKNGFLSIMPELNGYSASVSVGTGNRLPILWEDLETGQEFANLNNIAPSRSFKNRVSVGGNPGGGVVFPLRTNDSIPLLQSHFQKCIGTTPGAGTTYYEFAVNRERLVMSGSAFGTGSYNSTGTYSVFSINAYKEVNGSAYRFSHGLCDKLSFAFKVADEAMSKASLVFNHVDMVGTNLGLPYGGYSTLNSFPSHAISVDFFGLPIVAMDLDSNNNIKPLHRVGSIDPIHQFGRYQVSGRVVVDLTKTSLGHIGSMLENTSFPISATLYDSERNRMLFQMPTCRLKPFEMVVNSNTITMPFSAYESEDGGTAPLTIKLWTTGYSGTSFQPN